MKSRIAIVGLGTGRKEELTLGALQAMEQAERVVLRTGKHGITSFLREKGILFTTLDDIYQTSETFDELYSEMVKRIKSIAEEGDMILGVPGHPLIGERLTYELLKELANTDYEIEILPGISQADSFISSIHRCGVEGLKILTAAELSRSQLDPGLPAVIIQLDNELLVSDMKVRLLDVYPPELMILASHQREDGSSYIEEIPLHTLDHSRKFDHTSCIYLPKLGLRELTGYRFYHLVEVMEMLRAPEGCPWDREQSHETLKQFFIEETYEVLEAINLKDMDKLAEELGDVLLQVVFHAQIAKEHGEFSISDVITGICRKMIDRHTHIFGDVKVNSAEQVINNWEAIKKKEKGLKSHTQVLKDIPAILPALMRSYKIQQKAALVGFDWDKPEDAMAKAEEEFRELREAYQSGREDAICEELGDLLFAIVNVSRFLKQQPELALTAATEKFIRRFAYIEEYADKPLEEMTLEEMEMLWNQAKCTF
ncbi:MAG: nucleoside triphosphate pyrophosphohydrolase [Caldicoprobacterales bacterium]|jgi:tetrapyrrole methylase family protein/MazG family protein|nr:nucleoside triphosphate pyrophosphohydrolase [Clostridiales bacterium]